MLKPLPMQHISLKLLTEDVPLTAQLLADCRVFNPETSEQLPDTLGEQYRNVFTLARSRLEKILARIPYRLTLTPPHRIVQLSELENVNAQLGEIWQQISQNEEQLHQLNEQENSLKQLLDTLKTFSELDIDLKLFQKKAQFLSLHIGTVPIDNLEQFKEAIALAGHFVDIFHRDEQSAYLVIAGPQEKKVHPVLEHAEFQPLNIPFHNHPQQVHTELIKQLEQIQKHTKKVAATIQAIAGSKKTVLEHAYQTLNSGAAYAELTETLKGRGQLALIEGWIPSEDLPKLESTLKEKLHSPYVLSTRYPKTSEYPQVPSLIRHHRFLAPFITLVKNYGTPRYGEFDPTLLFTISFILMFGTMFGDVGHGALIAGAGWYWRDKFKSFTIFFIAAGFSSIIFGLLYGSIFGFEEILLPALWLSPIHNPNLMLKFALYWGIAFIILASFINLINNWRQGQTVLNIAGLLLYLGGIYAIQHWMEKDVFNTDQQFAILLPLLIILAYKWNKNNLPIAERILVTLIEGLETIINYLANTLSFLRVAAFSLNHAALAIAVFTLANMMTTPANWLTIILGNLFIIIIEGAIVTIQVLRLEYYEGFSRFFKGDGRLFRPLSIGINRS
ncbi:hypothetical protein PN36_23190 [Candidatus Thiomargarita nelsonii]|uniref:Uncharacterized protein n=1 Tax=Candidatus Thiomargarita nelsonii TaxID=1003181 RepID=A0A0A6PEF5_9GAMM|nr:hypothetical protein PN36_23190 [Candidatus Thiomargarita nelsonii]